jgi:hypothetical protein
MMSYYLKETFFSRNPIRNSVITGDNGDCYTKESYGKHQVSSHLQRSLDHHLLISIWFSHFYCIMRLCVTCWQKLCIFQILIHFGVALPTKILLSLYSCLLSERMNSCSSFYSPTSKSRALLAPVTPIHTLGCDSHTITIHAAFSF